MTGKLELIKTTVLVSTIKHGEQGKEAWLFEINTTENTIRIFRDNVEMGTFTGVVTAPSLTQLEELTENFTNVRKLQ